MDATLGAKPSYAWRSILHGRELLEKGLKRVVGNGRSLYVWTDKWLEDAIPKLEDGMIGWWHIFLYREIFIFCSRISRSCLLKIHGFGSWLGAGYILWKHGITSPLHIITMSCWQYNLQDYHLSLLKIRFGILRRHPRLRFLFGKRYQMRLQSMIVWEKEVWGVILGAKFAEWRVNPLTMSFSLALWLDKSGQFLVFLRHLGIWWEFSVC